MTHRIGNTGDATVRSSHLDGAWVRQARGLTDADTRRVARAVTAGRVIRNVNVLKLLPCPAVRACMFPTTRIGMEVPLGHDQPECKCAVVLPFSARRQLRRIDDPVR